ncbi:class I SAM-dependent methyltransferase [Streptomyces cyaneofuscatus]
MTRAVDARRDDSPDESRRAQLARIFDEDAELYDRARPGYPPALYDDLAELAGARPGSRVLEVGCGTGQATVPLAARGCPIIAVERCYERFDPQTPPGLRPPAAADVDPSDHVREVARNGLLGCVEALIEGRYGGRVTKRYLFELAVSHTR